jgi:hypothetical protein
MTVTYLKQKMLLVDFENVQQVGLANLDDTYRVIIFMGTNQKNVPLSLVANAQQLGSRIEWRQVTGEGRNALDFFIACELGRALDRTPKPDCVILSKDKGFDPLLKFLNAAGMKCRRITSLSELRHAAAAAEPTLRRAAEPRRAAATEPPHLRRVIELLGKLEKKARPRKRRTLEQSIAAMYQKRLSKQEIDRIIAAMITGRQISETGGTISYHF